MSLASLVDKPLMQNPLAGGGAPQIIDPSVITPRGGMFNVTPPSVPVSEQTPLPGIIDPSRDAQRKADEEFLKTADEYQRGFRESEFYKPFAPMTTDVAEFIYSSPTKGDITMKGSSSGIGQFGSYLESIGKGNLLKRVESVGSGPLATMEGQTPPGFGPQVIDQKLIDQTEFNQFPGNPNRKPADPANLGSAKVGIFPFPGMDSTETATATVPNPMQTGDQGLMDRLTSLEQGIGSLQNQIANLFQMGQASDPFGLGSFINTRRY